MKKTTLMALLIAFLVFPVITQAQTVQTNNEIYVAQKIVELQKQIDEINKKIDSILKNMKKSEKKIFSPEPVKPVKPCNLMACL